MMMEQERDYILCECALEKLTGFTAQLENQYHITITRLPSICLTMVRAEDSVEYQEFYLGEALTTECEVEIEGSTGYGICLGDEPERAYCMAVMDALCQAGKSIPEINHFLAANLKEVQQQEKIEFNQILSTRVDFKLMEQA